MENINTMLIIDFVIVVVGIYFLYVSLRMKRTGKVDSFVIAEEVLKNCKNQKDFADFLAARQMIFSIIMMITGALMIVHETFFDLGYAYYGVVGVLAIAFIVYYKQLTDGRIKYC